MQNSTPKTKQKIKKNKQPVSAANKQTSKTDRSWSEFEYVL